MQSIDGPEFGTLCLVMANAESQTSYSFHRSALVTFVDEYCAKQLSALAEDLNTLIVDQLEGLHAKDQRILELESGRMKCQS